MATTHLRTSEKKGGLFAHEQRVRTFDTVFLHFQLIIGFLFVGILVVSILYLAEFNHLASQGVVLDELSDSRNRLTVENEVWRMRISQLSSLDVITQQEVVKEMPGVVEVGFVE